VECRDDAERNQHAGASRRYALLQRCVKGGDISDDVICRHNQKQRIFVLIITTDLRIQRRQGRCRRRISALRFEYDVSLHAYRPQLFGHEKAVCFVTDYYRPPLDDVCGSRSQCRFLEHRSFAHERQELFRVHRARGRPEPRPSASRQYDGSNRGHQKGVVRSAVRPGQNLVSLAA